MGLCKMVLLRKIGKLIVSFHGQQIDHHFSLIYMELKSYQLQEHHISIEHKL